MLDDVITASAVVFCVSLLLLALIVARRAGGLRKLDDKVYDSRFGWVMPFGLEYKVGRRDGGTQRWWPRVLSWPFGGWMYDAGRARTASEPRSSGLPTNGGDAE